MSSDNYMGENQRRNPERRKDFRRSDDYYELEKSITKVENEHGKLADEILKMRVMLNQIQAAVFGYSNEKGLHQDGMMDHLESTKKIGLMLKALLIAIIIPFINNMVGLIQKIWP